MKKYTLRKTEGKRINSIASALRRAAIGFWIGGLIMGFVMGVKFGELGAFPFTSSHTEFSWAIAFAVWGSTFMDGLLILGFSEILFLLQENNTQGFSCEESAGMGPADTTDKEGGRDQLRFPLDSGDQKLPFSLAELLINRKGSDEVGFILTAVWPEAAMLPGILADLQLTNLYGDTSVIQNVSFVHLQRKGNITLVSDECAFKLPDNVLNCLTRIHVIVKKYTFQNRVHLPGENMEMPQPGNVSYGGGGVKDLLSAIDRMHSAKEIQAYVEQLKGRNDPVVTDELDEIVKQSAYIEKMYGNNYKECAKRIFKLFGIEYKPQDDPKKVVCPQCGKVIDEPSAVFCTACGTPIVR
ncbi:MAG: zinc ribbon domain-containing protein [Lachnospiraceae bacterium]|nr:zinc ribbon domain-containing protein [Lachnospiraceae bacterium]